MEVTGWARKEEVVYSKRSMEKAKGWATRQMGCPHLAQTKLNNAQGTN